MTAPRQRPHWIAWLAILFLGSQFVAVHHQSEVAHRHCVEHGRLEHVALDAHAGHGHEHEEDGPQAVPAPAPETEAHEACALAPCLNERAPQAPSHALPASPAQTPIAVQPVRAASRRLPIALLRLAPKQSPPV
jgi:hypothetical protein